MTDSAEFLALGPLAPYLGPLAPLVGDWEGNVGVDLSYKNKADKIVETTYYEKAWFYPIPVVENGQQTMHGLNYSMVAWRHGEEHLDPFHDEVGYLLWDDDLGQVVRSFAVPRGLAILAGSDATVFDTTLHFNAEPGSETYGLAQNKYLMGRATTKSFESSFTFNGDGTMSYFSDLVLDLAAIGEEMHHTDKNTLTRVNADVKWPVRL